MVVQLLAFQALVAGGGGIIAYYSYNPSFYVSPFVHYAEAPPPVLTIEPPDGGQINDRCLVPGGRANNASVRLASVAKTTLVGDGLASLEMG